MSHSRTPLIVGAGPVGLAAALFLKKQGKDVRVVEKLDRPVHQSKALAVNPRTLDILEPAGVTRQMLELGLPIHGGEIHYRGRILVHLSFQGIHPRYPFLLALSQATTEQLLADNLKASGLEVERGVELIDCQTPADGAEATLETIHSRTRSQESYPWILAADGAHSVVREKLGVSFEGSSLPGDWHLADVPLNTRLSSDRAHIFFLKSGHLLFMMRVVDPRVREQHGDKIWRVLSNQSDPLSHMVEAEPAGAPIWTSSFHIAHRCDGRFSVGNVHFAGDAAHIHSPLGARGMNLGIEDAWVFSELVRSNRLGDYDRLRRKVDRRVVRRVKLITRIASGQSAFFRFLRTFVLPTAAHVPCVRSQMLKTLTGLDHDLPLLSHAV